MTAQDEKNNKNYDAPIPTGNYLVQMRPQMSTRAAVKQLENLSSKKVAVAADYKQSNVNNGFYCNDIGAWFFEKLHVALFSANDGVDSLTAMTTLANHKDIASVRPEFHLFAIGNSSAAAREIDDLSECKVTWGIEAVGAEFTKLSGRGIKIAVLDTGLELNHPDFVGRNITAQSFVDSEDVQDQNGHGTHCIGSAAGPLNPTETIRYGIAHEAEIYVGKVLRNSGSGRESEILLGMDWAISENCEVISMSLGRSTRPSEPFDPIYEAVGQAALSANCLIIAAAGNESSRQFNIIAPVAAPANSPSIMAVAAVDERMKIADFSSGGINPNGGEVNLSAPGVDVFSTAPMPGRYARLSGTSMACPHVAGIAALLAESDTNLRGKALWNALRKAAIDIGLPSRDTGAGIVQVPGDAISLFS